MEETTLEWGVTQHPSGCCTASQDYLEDRVNRRLPGDLFQLQPFGRRIIVVREPAADKYKGIIDIPKVAQRVPSVGWVVAAGPQVGTIAGGNVAPIQYTPNELVGRKVQFGRIAGSAILIMEDSEEEAQKVRDYHGQWDRADYEAPYLLMNDLDLWCEIPNVPFRA